MILVDKTNMKKVPRETEEKIEFSLLEYTYSQFNVAAISSVFCAIVIFAGLYHSTPKIYLYTWFIIFLIISISRIITVQIFERYKSPKTNSPIWRNIFTIGAFLGGLGWGLMAFILFPHTGPLQQTLCILVLAGVTAGSITTLSALPTAAIGYIFISIMPMIIQLQFFRESIYNFFDFTLAAYLIFLSILSLRVHRMIKSVIFLRFENDALLSGLASVNDLLENLATHDSLTQLANSRLFQINLSNAIKRAKRDKKILAVLFFDIDKFKNVNDHYGHNIGNELLIKVSQRLIKTLRSSDPIARLGGDEFVILIEEFQDIENITKVAEKICQNISEEPFEINSFKINTSLSLGISIYPNDGSDVEILIKKADEAMYYAKQHGGNSIHFCTSEFNLTSQS